MFNLIKNLESKTVIERSKFYAFSFHCENEEKQKEILKFFKKEYASATHICSAGVYLVSNAPAFYTNDDGEPSGTAGLPILQAIKENELVNVLCVVVRYFGGVKLGASNLGRAYKECANSVLKGNKKQVFLKTKCKVHCDYQKFDYLKKYFDKQQILPFEISFENQVDFFCYLKDDEINFLKEQCKLMPLDEKKYC